MDWEQRRIFYEDAGKPNAQPHEDMAARRILRGLGYRNADKTIYQLEEAVLGQTQGELPLWYRTLPLLDTILTLNDCWILNRTPIIDVAKIKKHDEALERLQTLDWKTKNVRPILFARMGNTNNCIAYTFLTHEELGRLTPPFTILESDEHPDWYFTAQEAALFIEQFGPFRIQ